MWEVNLRATYTVTHQLLPCMLAAQKGTIICVSSVSPPSRGHAVRYCCTLRLSTEHGRGNIYKLHDGRACLLRVQLMFCTR